MVLAAKMPRENKVVLLGPPGAGKTSFFNRCTKPQSTFNKSHASTTLIDTQLFSQRVGEKVVDFYLVDTVGSSIFGESGTGGNVFVGVRIVLCLFNLNSKKSWDALVSSDRFDNLEYEIARRHGVMSRVDFIMVGAQCDLEQKVEVENIERFIESTTTKDETTEKINFFRLDRKYFKCSSKTGEGINEIMEFVAKTLAHDERPRRDSDGTINLTHSAALAKKDDECCTLL